MVKGKHAMIRLTPSEIDWLLYHDAICGECGHLDIFHTDGIACQVGHTVEGEHTDTSCWCRKLCGADPKSHEARVLLGEV